MRSAVSSLADPYWHLLARRAAAVGVLLNAAQQRHGGAPAAAGAAACKAGAVAAAATNVAIRPPCAHARLVAAAIAAGTGRRPTLQMILQGIAGQGQTRRRENHRDKQVVATRWQWRALGLTVHIAPSWQRMTCSKAGLTFWAWQCGQAGTEACGVSAARSGSCTHLLRQLCLAEHPGAHRHGKRANNL